MIVTFSRTKDDSLYNTKYGPVELTTEEPCLHEIIETKRGRMLKIEISNKNAYDFVLAKAFGVSFTSEWMYIPMKYVKSIKEGVSTEDYLKCGFDF